ncbi:hypothetical protein [Rudanella lutea]|nr:hypothetical protein [Rudanella lutea]
MAYSVCDPVGSPEGEKVLGAVNVPADVVAAELVKIPLTVPVNVP